MPSTSQASLAINFFPPHFPPKWASEWGEDEHGLWIAFTFNGIYQVFRWIPPGTFLMGSPANEPERMAERETQHQVTLMQGYWLADTACTQALWEAVMGNNPANFKDDNNNPVEQISWDDVQVFLQKLNGLIPGLDAALPTEAQWEHACRAGTTTPFSFGENITPEQVNYHGEYPYADGKKGLYRKKTVPVKSFPANPWGLYEMHGNIWEWCHDWFGDYPAEPVADPAGAETGSRRVLRGGSWRHNGGDVRSARRYWFTPDFRNVYIGFRFAPGQASNRAAEPHNRQE
jgi:formylglycine-generating enzyme required for sulfatase activity